jgi:hypothetical protein
MLLPRVSTSACGGLPCGGCADGGGGEWGCDSTAVDCSVDGVVLNYLCGSQLHDTSQRTPVLLVVL